MSASQRMTPEPGSWTWTVDDQDGFTAGRTDSRDSAMRWVYLVLSNTNDGEAVIDGPDGEEPTRVSRHGGLYYGETDW